MAYILMMISYEIFLFRIRKEIYSSQARMALEVFQRTRISLSQGV